MAEWIIFEAKKLDVPIVRNVPLAWSLYEVGELHEFIPLETYEAVAEVLKWVSSLGDAEELIEEELIDESLKGTEL